MRKIRKFLRKPDNIFGLSMILIEVTVLFYLVTHY
jgi:hypothetical protein